MSELEQIIETVRQQFPHGHPEFLPVVMKLVKLHSNKNHDYASGGRPLGNFERVSAIKKLYPGLDWTTPSATAIDYMLKQLDAVLWGTAQGIEHKVEGLEGRWQDIVVYSLICLCMLRDATPDSAPLTNF